jgi:predicted nucleic acid-binding protein
MDIALDTNIVIANPLLRGTPFSIVSDYLRKTNSRSLISAVVFLELEAHVRREVQALKNRARKVNDTFGIALLSYAELCPTAQAAEYIQNLKARLSEVGYVELPAADSYLTPVLKRAANRDKPCNQKGNGVRDSVTWLSLLDFARRTGRPIAFLTRDGDFHENGEPQGNLKDDLADWGAEIRFYSSLERFIDAVSSQVDFVTDEWILGALPSPDFLDRLSQHVVRTDLRMHFCDHEVNAPGEVAVNVGDWGIDQFSVYEYADGRTTLQTVFGAHATCHVAYDSSSALFPTAGSSESDDVRIAVVPAQVWITVYFDVDLTARTLANPVLDNVCLEAAS